MERWSSHPPSRLHQCRVSTVVPVVPLLPGDNDRGKQSLFLFWLSDGLTRFLWAVIRTFEPGGSERELNGTSLYVDHVFDTLQWLLICLASIFSKYWCSSEIAAGQRLHPRINLAFTLLFRSWILLTNKRCYSTKEARLSCNQSRKRLCFPRSLSQVNNCGN